jgi:hypothetical protein
MLLGPLTWAPVAARLTASGAVTVVPSLVDVADMDDPPFWPRVATTVNDAVSCLPPGWPIVLVAHSNAGLLVPVVVQAVGRPVVGCLFVDASLPSRAGPTPAASPERLTYLRSMATEGRLPQWTTWWDGDEVPGGHLHQLVDPDAVTARIVAMTAKWGRLN